MSQTTRANRSWRRKCAFAAVTLVAFFALLEAGLWLCGVEKIAETKDPFAGFAQVPLLETDYFVDGEASLTTAESKLVWFNKQTFPQQKPPGTKRIFCVGGSTTYGRPFWDTTSYSAWLRELLPLVDASLEWEVINAGGVSYASYRVAAVMEELAQYEPDLFVVYSVHNEFLERRTYGDMFDKSRLQMQLASIFSRTRTWTLLDRGINARQPPSAMIDSEIPPDEVDEILNHTVGPSDYHRDPKWADSVLRHYELNLQRMVAIAREAGSDIVFVTPASNEKDCSPFKSEPTRSISGDDLTQLKSHIESARSLLSKGKHDEALLTLEDAQRIDGKYAEVRYWLGKSLFELGRYDEAEEAFHVAIEQDVCPLRALGEVTAAINRVANRESVALVEFGKLLKDKCEHEFGHRCLGNQYFLDHVHPTIEVHRQLAVWIIEALQRECLVAGDSPTDEMVQEVQARIDGRVDVMEHGVALRNLAKVLHWSGKFDEAAIRADAALQLIEGDLESQFLLAECLRQTGRLEEAMREFDILFALEPDYVRGYIPFGTLLADQGHLTAAKVYLSMAATLFPDREDAFFALGQAHFKDNEFKLAAEVLEEAARLKPDDANIRSLLDDARGMLRESATSDDASQLDEQRDM